jgi:hypothetical protein
MATSSGVVKASVVGSAENTGVWVAQSSGINLPGGFVFTTVDVVGNHSHIFMWLDTVGRLRILACDVGPVVYTEGDQMLTFTNFDQDVNGNFINVT